MASLTLARVEGDTWPVPFATRETVAIETPGALRHLLDGRLAGPHDGSPPGLTRCKRLLITFTDSMHGHQ